jgi:NADH-quinone oxidoreductase subunit J
MAENLFLIIAALVIASAFWVVFSPNLIHSAVSLLFTLFGTAGLYIFLYADFIAATQVVIYVGGILILIIFGVMLTNRIDTPSIAASSKNQFIGGMGAFTICALQIGVIFNTPWHIGAEQSREATVADIGNLLLNEYLLPFEIVSILLLAALMGAALLSRRT